MAEQDNDLIMRERKRWGFFGIPWTFTKYSLKKKKLVIETGLFRSVEDEILLYRIVDITYSRALFQKLFKLGTIVIHARDKTNPVLVIKNIKHSREFKDKLSEMVEQDRIRMKMRQSEFVDAGMPDLEDYASDDF
ncbi:MAG: PH domain-containing protein [Clostridia bacterium]|nr:PH domain-containing protein [Clostridia bacterium]